MKIDYDKAMSMEVIVFKGMQYIPIDSFPSKKLAERCLDKNFIEEKGILLHTYDYLKEEGYPNSISARLIIELKDLFLKKAKTNKKYDSFFSAVFASCKYIPTSTLVIEKEKTTKGICKIVIENKEAEELYNKVIAPEITLIYGDYHGSRLDRILTLCRINGEVYITPKSIDNTFSKIYENKITGKNSVIHVRHENKRFATVFVKLEAAIPLFQSTDKYGDDRQYFLRKYFETGNFADIQDNSINESTIEDSEKNYKAYLQVKEDIEYKKYKIESLGENIQILKKQVEQLQHESEKFQSEKKRLEGTLEELKDKTLKEILKELDKMGWDAALRLKENKDDEYDSNK